MEKNKLGLVLSGGGTKGVAHAGVLKFLEEKNIQPDVLACCSAGSIVGSLYSAGKSPQEILDFFKSIYFFNWKHFAFNKPGLVSSKIFRIYLEPIFKDMKIGDLEKDLKLSPPNWFPERRLFLVKSLRLLMPSLLHVPFPALLHRTLLAKNCTVMEEF